MKRKLSFNQKQERDWHYCLFILGTMFGILGTLMIKLLTKNLVLIEVTKIITISYPFWMWIIICMLEFTGLGLFIVGFVLLIKKIITFLFGKFDGSYI
jgi:hypothetical protein